MKKILQDSKKRCAPTFSQVSFPKIREAIKRPSADKLGKDPKPVLTIFVAK